MRSRLLYVSERDYVSRLLSAEEGSVDSRRKIRNFFFDVWKFFLRNTYVELAPSFHPSFIEKVYMPPDARQSFSRNTRLSQL